MIIKANFFLQLNLRISFDIFIWYIIQIRDKNVKTYLYTQVLEEVSNFLNSIRFKKFRRLFLQLGIYKTFTNFKPYINQIRFKICEGSFYGQVLKNNLLLLIGIFFQEFFLTEFDFSNIFNYFIFYPASAFFPKGRRFGRFKKGLQCGFSAGTPQRAARSGTVVVNLFPFRAFVCAKRKQNNREKKKKKSFNF